jgi:hypothetical protein
MRRNQVLVERPDLFRSQKIAAHLQEERDRKQTEYPRWEDVGEGVKVPIFWPSSAGDCRRKLCYELMHPEQADPDTVDGALRMYDGAAHQASTVHWLNLMGYHVEGTEIPVNRLVRRKKKPIYRIRGRMDGVIWLPDPEDKKSNYRAVLECKGLSTFTCKAKDPLDVISPSYRDQAHMYMSLAQLRHALFVIKDKNNSELHFYELQLRDDRVTELRSRLRQVSTAVSQGTLLPRDYHTPTQRPCSWCSFNKVCWGK